jgi:transcription antitermination factor NusG
LRAWFALKVRAGSESRAKRALEARSIVPYWPRYQALKRIIGSRLAARRKSWRSVIPGLMFVPVDYRAVHETIRSYSTSIQGVLADAGGKWVTIPDNGRQSMETIRQIEAALNASAIAARDGIPFRVGQRVRVERLASEGTIARIDGTRQITVEAFMFGRVTRMIVPVSEIESV